VFLSFISSECWLIGTFVRSSTSFKASLKSRDRAPAD